MGRPRFDGLKIFRDTVSTLMELDCVAPSVIR